MPSGVPSEQLGLNPAKENVVTNIQALHAEMDKKRDIIGEGKPGEHSRWCHGSPLRHVYTYSSGAGIVFQTGCNLLGVSPNICPEGCG